MSVQSITWNRKKLESLGDEIKDIQTYQGLPQLFQEPLPITESPGALAPLHAQPEELEELVREYKKYKEISKEPTEEEVEKKTLEESREREFDRMKEYEDETSEESEEEMGAMSFDPAVLNKEIDLELLDRKNITHHKKCLTFNTVNLKILRKND